MPDGGENNGLITDDGYKPHDIADDLQTITDAVRNGEKQSEHFLNTVVANWPRVQEEAHQAGEDIAAAARRFFDYVMGRD